MKNDEIQNRPGEVETKTDYDENGRKIHEKGGETKVESFWEYDELGREIYHKKISTEPIVVPYPFVPRQHVEETFYRYNDSGEQKIWKKRKFNNGNFIPHESEYDEEGRVICETICSESEKLIRRTEYDSNGCRTKISKQKIKLSDGKEITLWKVFDECDDKGRVIFQKSIFSKSEAIIVRSEYDANGYIAKRKEISVLAGKEIPTKEITFRFAGTAARFGNGEKDVLPEGTFRTVGEKPQVGLINSDNGKEIPISDGTVILHKGEEALVFNPTEEKILINEMPDFGGLDAPVLKKYWDDCLARKK